MHDIVREMDYIISSERPHQPQKSEIRALTTPLEEITEVKHLGIAQWQRKWQLYKGILLHKNVANHINYDLRTIRDWNMIRRPPAGPLMSKKLIPSQTTFQRIQ